MAFDRYKYCPIVIIPQFYCGNLYKTPVSEYLNVRYKSRELLPEWSWEFPESLAI